MNICGDARADILAYPHLDLLRERNERSYARASYSRRAAFDVYLM